MKQGTTSGTAPGECIALALTWDGVRWPVNRLPVKARAFLEGGSRKTLACSATRVAGLFANDRLKEIRLCWVPRLRGGEDVLAVPFAAPDGKRIGFRITRRAVFGEVLGVVYRRNRSR